MWTAIIDNKTLENGVLRIGVVYTDGNSKFTESIDMTGGTADILDVKLKSRLATLNSTDALFSEVAQGAYDATIPKGVTGIEDFLNKYRIAQSAKRVVDLGLMASDDPVFTAALADAQKAFDPSYLGRF